MKPSMFPGKPPEPVPGQIGMAEHILSGHDHETGGMHRGRNYHVYVCKDRIKRGEPAVTVADKDTGETVARGSDLCLNGEWHLRQYDDPKPCGSTVVLETTEGTWRID